MGMRKMTWVLIGWATLIIGWVLVGGANSLDRTAERCERSIYLSQRTCESAGHTGTMLGLLVVLLVGFCGFVVLSLIWFMTRPAVQR